MDCPICSVPLIVVEREKIELDYCISCKGFWFDAEELKHLTDVMDIDSDIPDIEDLPKSDTKEKTRKCPRCDKSMEKIYLKEAPNMVIDRCPGGEGIWLDKGELGRAIDSYSKESREGNGKIVQFLGEFFYGS